MVLSAMLLSTTFYHQSRFFMNAARSPVAESAPLQTRFCSEKIQKTKWLHTGKAERILQSSCSVLSTIRPPSSAYRAGIIIKTPVLSNRTHSIKTGCWKFCKWPANRSVNRLRPKKVPSAFHLQITQISWIRNCMIL